MFLFSKVYNFYNMFFRTKLFNKIVLVYSVITIAMFVTLAVLIYIFFTNSILQKELSAQTEAVDKVARYLDQKKDQSQYIVLQLYQDNTLAEDVLYLLRNDLLGYIQHRFDRYLSNSAYIGRDLDTFFLNQMNNDEDLLNIALYSPEQSFLYVYHNSRNQSYSKLDEEERQQASALQAMRYSGAASPRTPEIDKLLDISQTGAYTFTFNLNDPDTLQNIGILYITYNPQGIGKILRNTRQQIKGSVLVLFPDGQTVFDSSGKYNGQSYPYAGRLQTSESYAHLEENSYISTVRTDKTELLISGIVTVSEMETNFHGFKTRIILITGICILVTILVSYLALYRYVKKTRTILKAMKLVQQGNLSVRIPVSKEDELDDISSGFNRMCEDLLNYINKMYVSEIKQKHAELIAFQAQINPHFLYNTLEAIRMRAIAQGAKDVGEMTYILGTLFRYTVKNETVVTLEEEMENCIRYLELYRVRYKNKIDYRFTVDDRVQPAAMLKLTLQPLLENAVKHGLSQGGRANLIEIDASLDERQKLLTVEIRDSGTGIEPNRLREIHQSLEGSGAAVPADSPLGLRNVHERIRLMYGENYGLSISSEPGQGTVVRLLLPFHKKGA
ncbi:sensor histidine kinase [Paenibacillus tarimensis]